MPRPWAIAVALGLGVLGFAAGRGTAPMAQAPDCGAVSRELDEEREVRQLLERELYGEPIPWPAEVPPERTESGYRAALTEVLATCRPTWTLGELDCAEPPCIAVIWPSDARMEPPVDCPPWVDRYGPTAQSAAQSVDCGGKGRRLILLSPSHLDPVPVAAVELENRARRIKSRWDELRHDAKCP